MKVADLSTGIAGAYCSKLLADAGADVTRVGAHPLEQWRRGALYAHLAANVARSPAAPSDADAIVWSPGAASTPDELTAEHPDAVVVAISPFGLGTSWSDRPATEFTLQAWSGAIIGLGRGDPERPPVHVGGQVGEWLAGTYAAIAALAAARAGTPGVVDLSMLEVQALCLTYYPVTFHDFFGRPMRKRRALTLPGVAQAKDGLVGLGVGTGQQWLDFAAMVGHPEWAEDTGLFTERGALAPAIAEWVGARTVDEVRDLATGFRLPNAPIVDGANVRTFDHLRERVGRPPVRWTPTGSAPLSVARSGSPRPLADVRVLDMTAYWAGPSASHVVAMLGADVIHVESAKRPDGARLVGAPKDLERGPIFAAMNTNKRGVAIDFTTPEGQAELRQLIAACDVVIENYTPRVLEQNGLGYDELRAIRDDLIVVRMPGFGLDGPWRDNAAFAFIIEDASGLTALTGHPDQLPVEPYCVGDSNAGLHAAYGLLAALAHRDRTGEGCLVEAAMIDAALSITVEQAIEFDTTGVALQRAGNRGPLADPQDLYACADTDEYDRESAWVAIAAATDAQRAALESVLGGADLGEWCRERTADEVVDKVWAAGVPVGRVLHGHRQPELAPLIERCFFETLDHPVAGEARYSTLPFRLPGSAGPIHRTPAPLLGQHNEDLIP